MTTWEEIRDEVAGMLADGESLENIIGKLEKMKNEMVKANLLKAIDDIKKRDIDDWGVCKDCAIKDNCSHYKPFKRQCEDYEREPQTNFEQITKDEATLTDWLQEKMCFCTEIPCDECIAHKECWHQGNDTDYSNADLWNGWLKQPHTTEER